MKLVRDKVIKIIEEQGKIPHYHKATPLEYESFLYQKLIEESNEIIDAQGSIEEIADLVEVLIALAEFKGFTPDDLEKAYKDKREQAGVFKERYILERIEHV